MKFSTSPACEKIIAPVANPLPQSVNHLFPTLWTALSFLTLKLSDLGLFDGTKFEFVPVFS